MVHTTATLWVKAHEENRRLSDLAIVDPAKGGLSIEASSGTLSTARVQLIVEHSGQSKLTSGGKSYLFRVRFIRF